MLNQILICIFLNVLTIFLFIFLWAISHVESPYWKDGRQIHLINEINKYSRLIPIHDWYLCIFLFKVLFILWRFFIQCFFILLLFQFLVIFFSWLIIWFSFDLPCCCYINNIHLCLLFFCPPCLANISACFIDMSDWIPD